MDVRNGIRETDWGNLPATCYLSIASLRSPLILPKGDTQGGIGVLASRRAGITE